MIVGEQLLPKLLDELKVSLIVGIGEGAGANVLVRFALTNQQRTLGKHEFIKGYRTFQSKVMRRLGRLTIFVFAFNSFLGNCN